MITHRQFRTVNIPSEVFSHCVICAERMGISLTKKEVLKKEGDNFDGIIEGTQPISTGQLMIRIKVHGWRDTHHHGGFWPTSLTSDVMIETFEIQNDEELPDTPNVRNLHENYNFRLGRYYLWHTSG